MRVVGIDLSLTGTGLAEIRDGEITTKVILSSGKKDDDLETRFNRQTTISSEVIEFALVPRYPELIVIEGLFNSGTFAGSLIDRSGLWWRIVGSLLCYGIPIVVATPQQGKKFLTGAGNSDKGDMTMSAARIYPQWTPTTRKNTNDEADAIALASIAAGLMLDVESWPFPETDYRHKIIDDLDKKQLRGRITTA